MEQLIIGKANKYQITTLFYIKNMTICASE